MMRMHDAQERGATPGWLLDELASGALDAVMLALPAEGGDVETLPLFDDPFLLAVPAADKFAVHGRVNIEDVDQRRLILLEEGHCLRDQALAFCATTRRDQPASLGATSLATVTRRSLIGSVACEITRDLPLSRTSTRFCLMSVWICRSWAGR